MSTTDRLADEQRTANLIAWHRFLRMHGDRDDLAADVELEVNVRLGILSDTDEVSR